MADTLLRLIVNGNKGTTKYPTYKKENMSQINDIKESPEGIYPTNLKLIDQYHRKYPRLMARY